MRLRQASRSNDGNITNSNSYNNNRNYDNDDDLEYDSDIRLTLINSECRRFGSSGNRKSSFPMNITQPADASTL